MSDFAKNLRYYRKQKKLSQAKLAQGLNYGYTAIANYESGRNEPSLDDLIRLARILNVTPDALLGFRMRTAEEKMLFMFYNLNEQKQKMMLEFLDALQS